MCLILLCGDVRGAVRGCWAARNATGRLKKWRFAGRLIFRENPKREAIADSYSLTRFAEVAGEFNVIPHVFTRGPRLRPAEFLNTSAKRLLQHNLRHPDVCGRTNALTTQSMIAS